MSLVKCPECGKEISDTVKACPNCGVKIKKMKKKTPRKKKIIVVAVCGIVLILALGMGITTVYLSSPVMKFQRELSNFNYEGAKEILRQDIASNQNEYTKAKKEAVSIMNGTLDNYAKGKASYDDCKEVKQFVTENFSDVNNNDYQKLLDDMKLSKSSYDAATSKQNEKEYIDAIMYYGNVKKEDTEHYKNAKKNIQTCKNKYKDDIISQLQANENSDTPEKEFSAIAKKISQTDWVKSDEEISKELSKLSEIVKKNIITKADSLAETHKYSDAINYINENLTEEYLKSDEIKEKVASLKKILVRDIIKKSDKYIAQGKLKNASKLLKKNLSYDVDNALEQKLKGVNKEIKKGAVKEFRTLKKQVTVGYDSVDKTYQIVGKGYSTDYVNVSNSTNVEARVYVHKEDKTSSFLLAFGFQQENFIFTDSITITDGKYNTGLAVNYVDLKTEIHIGEISEWVMFIDTSTYDKFYSVDAPSLDSDSIDVIDALTSSKKVTIRFCGEGKRDHVVTASEKKNIKNIRRMYELLQKYPELYKEF